MFFAILICGFVACQTFAHLGGNDVPVVDGLVEDFDTELLVDVAYDAE
jgi:hypothetical protein